MSKNLGSSALGSYKVLDLTRARAGPTAARQLADFGADVIKIEAPGDGSGGDLGARTGPDFQNLHRNKRSLCLDLKAPESREIFSRLVETSDVVIENYRPNVKHRLKIDFDELESLNPKLIYASISGFGQTGPYADRPGLDQIAQGMGGHMSVTGKPGSGPWRSGAAISDITAGILTATGILAALLEREKTNKGQWLHTSLLEAQIFLLDFQAARWLVDGEAPFQEGNNHPTNVPMGTFQTQDGFINIAPMAAMWPRFCNAMGLKNIKNSPEFVDNNSRRKNRKELDRIITDETKQQTSSYWIKHLNHAGIPCGPIYKIDEMFEDPQVEHLGIAQEVESFERGPINIIGQPVHLTRTPASIKVPSPGLGQHTDEILQELGYSKKEISLFYSKKVV
ncbi:MAG: CoA transferase [Pseudomonadota bacterium]|nr:CoA transferase [Pseudomonadota bacterium]